MTPTGLRIPFPIVKRLLPLLAVLVALVAGGCGGASTSVPSDAVARVGSAVITKAQFDALMNQAKTSYKSTNRKFPKPGTPERAALQNQALQFLIQRAEFDQKAKDMGIEISDKQIDDRLSQIKKQYFGGSEKRYLAQLKKQGLTDKQVREDVRAQLVSEAITKKVTADVKVSDKEVEAYYAKHKEQYGTPESRDIRHILVSNKALADRLYQQLQNGANFAALARKYSKDPGSAKQGGKLTITKGSTVAPFDQTAFFMHTGQISHPVKTQYGYHIIQALSDIKPAKTTPLSQVKDAIRGQLLQQKKNEAMTKWVNELKKEFAKKIHYQVGYAPPTAASSTSK